MGAPADQVPDHSSAPMYRQARLSRPELRRRIRALGARDIATVLRAVADPENARRLGQAVVARGRAQQLWPGLRHFWAYRTSVSSSRGPVARAPVSGPAA